MTYGPIACCSLSTALDLIGLNFSFSHWPLVSKVKSEIGDKGLDVSQGAGQSEVRQMVEWFEGLTPETVSWQKNLLEVGTWNAWMGDVWFGAAVRRCSNFFLTLESENGDLWKFHFALDSTDKMTGLTIHAIVGWWKKEVWGLTLVFPRQVERLGTAEQGVDVSVLSSLRCCYLSPGDVLQLVLVESPVSSLYSIHGNGNTQILLNCLRP